MTPPRIDVGAANGEELDLAQRAIQTHSERLPLSDELAPSIAEYLDPCSLARLEQTSKSMRQLYRTEQAWHARALSIPTTNRLPGGHFGSIPAAKQRVASAYAAHRSQQRSKVYAYNLAAFHDGYRVLSACLSDGGATGLSGDIVGRLVVWRMDANTGPKGLLIAGSDAPQDPHGGLVVQCADISPDGETGISAGANGKVVVWSGLHTDSPTGRLVAGGGTDFDPHDRDRIQSVCMGKDGKTAISYDQHRKVTWTDLNSDSPGAQVEGLQGSRDTIRKGAWYEVEKTSSDGMTRLCRNEQSEPELRVARLHVMPADGIRSGLSPTHLPR